LKGCNIGITGESDLTCAVEMGSLLPTFMKIGAGLHAILRFSVRNLRRCNVGITDGSYEQGLYNEVLIFKLRGKGAHRGV
jgi:hypothetical protein